MNVGEFKKIKSLWVKDMREKIRGDDWIKGKGGD